MKFEVYQDTRNEYRWRFRAGNQKIIATSGEGYRNKQDCLHGIQLIKTHAANASVVDTTTTHQSRW